MKNSKLSVVILGAGNVAFHLYKSLRSLETITLQQIYNRSKDNLEVFKDVETTTFIEDIKEADLYIIAVNDDVIGDLAQKLKTKKGIVVHTSGAKPLDEVAMHTNYGVFYPLQSFSKDLEVNFQEVPICIEANSKKSLEQLNLLANALSNKVYHIDSKQRKSLHLSAVFVNNFSNYMFTVAQDLCDTNNVPFEILHPLITETALKATLQSPKNVQTGPAKRGDKETIQSHLEQLKDTKHKDVYKQLTLHILTYYGNKL